MSISEVTRCANFAVKIARTAAFRASAQMRRCLHKKAKPGSKKRLTKLDAQTNSSAASDVSTTEHAFQLPPEQITVLDTPSQLGHLIDAVHSALQNNQAVFNDPSSQSCKLLQLQPLALDCERVDKTPNISVVSIAVGSRHCFVCDVFKLDSHACKMYIDLLIDLLEGPCLPIFTPLATCRKGWGALEALRYAVHTHLHKAAPCVIYFEMHFCTPIEKLLKSYLASAGTTCARDQ